MAWNRRILVIGSQCNNLNHLSFLPDVAVRFHALMMAPGPGECPPAGRSANRQDSSSTRLFSQAKAAIKTAYDSAARNGDTLILAYIGHAEFVRQDFYLMPTDAADPPNSEDAIHLAQFISDRPAHPREGLIVLLDTSYAGAGAWDAAEYWVRSMEGRLRFEVLTATDDRPTANAWFTRPLDPIARAGRSRVRRSTPL